jgi:hypothetical protein
MADAVHTRSSVFTEHINTIPRNDYAEARAGSGEALVCARNGLQVPNRAC